VGNSVAVSFHIEKQNRAQFHKVSATMAKSTINLISQGIVNAKGPVIFVE
jgi:hypothetical protein